MGKYDKILSKLKKKDYYTLMELVDFRHNDVMEAKNILLKILHDEVSSIPLNNNISSYKYIYKIFRYLGEPKTLQEKEKIIRNLNDCLRICNNRITSALANKKSKQKIAVLQKIRDIIEVTIIELEYLDIKDRNEEVSYNLLMYLIFEVKNYNYLFEIIKTYPDRIIACNSEGKYLIEELIDRYLLEITKTNNQTEIIYLEKIIKLFMDDSKLKLDKHEIKRIVDKLYNQVLDIDSLKLNREEKINMLFFINEIISVMDKTVHTKEEVIEMMWDAFNYIRFEDYDPYTKIYMLRFFDNIVSVIEEDSVNNKTVKDIQNDIIEISKIPFSKRDKKFLDSFNNVVLKYLNDMNIKNNSHEYLEYKYAIKKEISNDVLEEAKRLTLLDDKEVLDCTDKYIVTIDGENTCLYDDAISIEKLPNGNRLLGIYLADAASFIKPDSLIDKRAYELAQTVYLPGSYITMLPEPIFEKMTLKSNEKRRAIGYFFLLDEKMNCINFYVKRCLIKVSNNFSYDMADSYLTDSRSIDEIKILKEMYEVSMSLNQKDKNVEEYRKVKQIKKMILTQEDIVESMSSNMIVNFMVFINSFIASFFASHPELPFIYRNNLVGFNEKVLKKINNIIEGDLNYQEALRYVKILNSPSFYSLYNQGHKKLNLDAYCHLSNPLRSYCSLELQRLVIKYMLEQDYEVLPEERIRLKKLCEYLNSRMQMNNEYKSEIENIEAKRKTMILTNQ